MPCSNFRTETLAKLELGFNELSDLGSEVLVLFESLCLHLIPDARLTVFHPLGCTDGCTSYPAVVFKLAQAERYIGPIWVFDQGARRVRRRDLCSDGTGTLLGGKRDSLTGANGEQYRFRGDIE
jgi:hypothetical protein